MVVTGNWGRASDRGNKDHGVRVKADVSSGKFLRNMVQVSAGGGYTCALESGGGVRCWGHNGEGQLGQRVEGGVVGYPVRVVGGSGTGFLSNVVQISSGGSHSCALTTGQEVWCWGNNGEGQLGRRVSGAGVSYPVRVVGGSGTGFLSNVVQISSGGSHTCALAVDGVPWCWGRGSDGELGHGRRENRDHPVMVAGARGRGVLSVGTHQSSYVCLEQADCARQAISLGLAAGSPSPGNNSSVNVEISGMSVGQTVSLYRDATCSSSALAAGSLGSSDSPVSLSGLSEGEHRWHFTVARASGGASLCSQNFLTYVLDTQAPAIPTVTLPVTAGSDATPEVEVGNVEVGGLVQIYSDRTCLTTAAVAKRFYATSGRVTVDAIASPGSYVFYAQVSDIAGNFACAATGASYTYSLSPPGAVE